MSNESPFDPEAFLASSLPGSNSTKREVIPMGTYRAFVSKVDVRNGTVKKEGPNFGRPWVSLNIKWEIEDEALKAQLGQTKIIAFQSVMLDLTDEGGIDMAKGRNVNLGKLREATGLNSGAVQLRALEGRPAMIHIEHEVYKDEIQANVKSVAKA